MPDELHLHSDGSEHDLRERVADALAHNDACGPGPVSRQEYLDDAATLIALVRADGLLPRTEDGRYDLLQRLNRAVRWLREAEDIARLEMPALPTADRIREIYEQVTEDVLNGKTTVPPLRERLTVAEAAIRDVLDERTNGPTANAEFIERRLLEGLGQS